MIVVSLIGLDPPLSMGETSRGGILELSCLDACPLTRELRSLLHVHEISEAIPSLLSQVTVQTGNGQQHLLTLTSNTAESRKQYCNKRLAGTSGAETLDD
ncbi:hypothetical protein PG984_010752 [Apiospora sp. TS-2023a]